MYTIAAGSTASKADILVRVSFARIYHRVDIELVGNGKIDQANFNEIAYGDTFFLDITADEHNYIEAVEIDGIRVEISNTNLQNYTFNNVTQKYTERRFQLVEKQTSLHVTFLSGLSYRPYLRVLPNLEHPKIGYLRHTRTVLTRFTTIC